MTFNVEMHSDTEVLDDVVVVAYGSAKREAMTGSVTSVKGDQIASTPVASVDKALAGKLASWKNEPNWRKRREKAFRFLANRGFALDLVYETLDNEPSLNYPD